MPDDPLWTITVVFIDEPEPVTYVCDCVTDAAEMMDTILNTSGIGTVRWLRLEQTRRGLIELVQPAERSRYTRRRCGNVPNPLRADLFSPPAAPEV